MFFDTRQGDEVCIDYVPAADEGSNDTQSRRDYLLYWYGFNCVCPACCNLEGETDRRRIMEIKAKGLESLSAYQLEELVDTLDRIGSKVDFRERMNALLFDKAVHDVNDRVLAAKAFSSVLLYKTIKSCPKADEWKADFQGSKSVVINGRWYLFPPDM